MAFPLLKPALLAILFCMPAVLCAQVSIEGPWTMEFGASTSSGFRQSSAVNLRYISPRFRWYDGDRTEEETKHPERYRNSRLMLEMIYTPPLKVLCTSFNVQHRLIRYKKLSVELYGGLKFFFLPGGDFAMIPPLKNSTEMWYMNLGLIMQLNLGRVAPFVDVGGDSILTVGAELDLRAIYKKPKRRYKLNARPAS